MNLQDQTQVNKRARRLTLINSVIGVSIAGISTRVFMISVPTLATALGTDILGISWALIVYQVAAIGLGVVCGRLGDVYSHHKMYGFGMALMAVGSLLCGLSQDVSQLILFRFVQGVGGAMIQSSGRTLAYKSMPEGSEGKAQGLMAMSHQFGFFVGPPIGGLIIDLVNWRGIFFLLLLPSLIGLVLSLMTGRSVAEPAARSRSVDYLGALLFLGLTILVTVLLDQKIAQAIGAANQTLLVLTFVGLLWGFIYSREENPEPDDRSQFFLDPRFWLRFPWSFDGLHHARAHYVCHAFLPSGRAKSLTDVHGNYLSCSVATQHGASACERRHDRSYRCPISLDHGRAHLDGCFSNWGQSSDRLPLDLAYQLARTYGYRFDRFQYAIAGGDGGLTP